MQAKTLCFKELLLVLACGDANRDRSTEWNNVNRWHVPVKEQAGSTIDAQWNACKKSPPFVTNTGPGVHDLLRAS